MTKYIAALDQGTTSTRCIIFSQSGEVISVAQKEHRQIYPQAGWVEHDPREILSCATEVVKSAINQSGLNYRDICAMGVTNQRETSIVWDSNTGIPYYNAIVWQDTRTKKICDELAKEGGQDRFRSQVGLPLATYFSAPKIMWLIENIPGVHLATEKGDLLFGNVDTWLIWWLTGGPNGGAHVTDVTNASRTMLMNLSTLEWDTEILDALDIPSHILPRIVSSSDPSFYGFTNLDEKIQSSIPICGDLGDQQAALVGQTCLYPGEAKNTYGTGCFMLLNTGDTPIPSKSGLLTTLAYKFADLPPMYALEGSVAITGALVQWLRDNLNLIQNSSQVEELASSVSDNGGIYFVPAFSGLFAPYWRSDARGVIVGLTRYVNKGHFARAALESTAYQTREVLDAMQRDSGVTLQALKVDGGMVYNNLLMQFQADMLNVPVVRPKIVETTSWGAAIAAGLAVGVWDNLDEIRASWQADTTWQPQMDSVTRDKLYHNWLRAVERSLNWVE